ncbi:hypothetical protein VP1G_10767 [Cytospora mali]|uniref:Uncharacterized protein n=1 Tax=Cytospora mali TaxID=578113 RepID=A0A194UWQ6_CYTMA|nr:hypothetical protein VP1G_10767 [Valsa mali var. pyri (nom. inval.)]
MLARRVQERPLLDAGAVRVGQEARRVRHAHLDGRMYPQALAAERDAMVAVVPVARLEAVHKQGLALGLDGIGGGPVGEAVLQAEDEPLDPGEDARDVLGGPDAVVAVPGRLAVGLVGHVGVPDDGAARVGEPPDADKVSAVPQRCVPVAQHHGVRVDGLLPLQAVGGDGLELDLHDDAQRAERQERRAEELVVLGAGAGARGAVGGHDPDLHDGLAYEPVVEGRAVRAGGDDARGGLLVDAAQVGHGQPHAVELLAQLPQADAGLEVDDVGVPVAAGEVDGLLDLGDGLGPDVELGAAGEGAGPGLVGLLCCGAEGDPVGGVLLDHVQHSLVEG